MTELKTFKDLNFDKLGFHEKRTAEYLVENLKKEAIKWIKELEKDKGSFCLKNNEWEDDEHDLYMHEGCEHLTTSDPYEPHGCVEAVIWIKHFFNISEEDLNGI